MDLRQTALLMRQLPTGSRPKLSHQTAKIGTRASIPPCPPHTSRHQPTPSFPPPYLLPLLTPIQPFLKLNQLLFSHTTQGQRDNFVALRGPPVPNRGGWLE